MGLGPLGGSWGGGLGSAGWLMGSERWGGDMRGGVEVPAALPGLFPLLSAPRRSEALRLQRRGAHRGAAEPAEPRPDPPHGRQPGVRIAYGRTAGGRAAAERRPPGALRGFGQRWGLRSCCGGGGAAVGRVLRWPRRCAAVSEGRSGIARSLLRSVLPSQRSDEAVPQRLNFRAAEHRRRRRRYGHFGLRFPTEGAGPGAAGSLNPSPPGARLGGGGGGLPREQPCGCVCPQCTQSRGDPLCTNPPRAPHPPPCDPLYTPPHATPLCAHLPCNPLCAPPLCTPCPMKSPPMLPH